MTEPRTEAGKKLLEILTIQARHVSLSEALTQDFPDRILAIEEEASRLAAHPDSPQPTITDDYDVVWEDTEHGPDCIDRMYREAGIGAAHPDSGAEVAALRSGIRRILNELGVPGDGYPAPVANAVAIGDALLTDEGLLAAARRHDEEVLAAFLDDPATRERMERVVCDVLPNGHASDHRQAVAAILSALRQEP